MNEKLVSVFSYFPSFAGEAPKPQRPWRLGPWLWATQGHVLVAVQDDGSEADETPEKMRKADKYLTDAPLQALRPVSLSALRAFAGPVKLAKPPCRECEGSGRAEFDDLVICEHCGESTRVECEACGGDGIGWIEARNARVDGIPLNLNLLAFGLSVVPPDEAGRVGYIESLTATKDNLYRALAVVGPTWRVVLMGIRECAEDVPEFRSDAATADAAVAKG